MNCRTCVRIRPTTLHKGSQPGHKFTPQQAEKERDRERPQAMPASDSARGQKSARAIRGLQHPAPDSAAPRRSLHRRSHRRAGGAARGLASGRAARAALAGRQARPGRDPHHEPSALQRLRNADGLAELLGGLEHRIEVVLGVLRLAHGNHACQADGGGDTRRNVRHSVPLLPKRLVQQQDVPVGRLLHLRIHEPPNALAVALFVQRFGRPGQHRGTRRRGRQHRRGRDDVQGRPQRRARRKPSRLRARQRDGNQRGCTRDDGDWRTAGHGRLRAPRPRGARSGAVQIPQ
mmetsp:Transcript_6139/g.16703  ORF Transcript_6139/g.16703 Transcript_6139/m.16703 type:complete len:290 (-) Transcript_6139:38-907(-)